MHRKLPAARLPLGQVAGGRNGGGRDAVRRGPVERAAEAVPPPGGRGFRWIVVTLLALSTAALGAMAVLLGLVYQRLEASDAAGLKTEIADLQRETASFHADVGKALTTVQKSLADEAVSANAATLQLNDIALSLHRKP